ncbi:Nif3-like dinuclear metal center hexameric protein [Enterococcus sp. LJL120]
MKINEIITKLKGYYSGIDFNGQIIDEETTRDKVLFGSEKIDIECTGIVTCCWASAEVIKKAGELNANLIICHEALFWNHGDRTDWLKENETYLEKKQLLEENKIVVWRNHDYIHSGFPLNGAGYVDGIFYGLAKKLGWESYIQEDKKLVTSFLLPETTVEEVANDFIQKLNLNGAKIIGNSKTKVSKTFICAHVMGEHDRELITLAEKEKIELLIALELIDYTLTENIHDRSFLNQDKAILTVGHFNTEEVGMEYMLEYLDEALGEKVPAHFIQSGDMYTYITP